MEMDKSYNPKSFEERIYSEWERGGYFSADTHSGKKPYCIVIPPPNITGSLHMGHALNHTIQDALIRFKRMQGYSALWLPGTDHASIATEVKIVEKLRAEGLSKERLGREEFLKRAWEWKDAYGGRIIGQMKKLGDSCDWDRLAFTMDDRLSRAVKDVFIKLYGKGLIYKGSRIINWCPECKTALSDAEVDHITKDGSLWHIKYPLTDGGGFVTVATTRPETMLGDTAVAVNPDDKRYQKLIGKTLNLPLTDRIIPVIADGYVDKAFGTGAVKITPAHDPNDFEVGARHGLPGIRIMDDGGVINASGKYFGMERFAARKSIVADLAEAGLLVKIEPHTNNVGHCYRCHKVIEPIVSEQWFVKMESLAAPAATAVTNGDVRFTPGRFSKIYLHWLNHIRDWCISRQLWWGHRIPAYYCADCGETVVAADRPCKCPKCGGARFEQDGDVLDTWFSSALWPFSTLGYPDETEDIKFFFPTNTLVTAQDIIFFWVARMIFSSLEFTGEIPFKDIVINGIVRDAQGRKMSKSLGNGIDPLELIDAYGADALRFSLLFGSMGKDMRFSAEKVELDRPFINKIWNASRYVLTNLEGAELSPIEELKLTRGDKWILHKLNDTVKRVTRLMEKFELGKALDAVYSFAWQDFCDWYIEMSKPSLYAGDKAVKNAALSVLSYVLKDVLKLLHPFIPFVTEEIYSYFAVGEKIITAAYPVYRADLRFTKDCKQINTVLEIIRQIRAERLGRGVPQSKRTNLYICPAGNAKVLESALPYIEKLGMGISATIVKTKPDMQVVTVIAPYCEVYLPLGELVDKDKETARLKKEVETAEAELKRAVGKLSNPGFTQKAPAALLEEERAKVTKYTELLQKLNTEIEKLK
ncbi:MAG: valine--tRNA ligase [Clostridiales bacterium]|jgi:valyl-tRNA synthetase|nr:valine--tRNA ligase [Clostridiales bacterium]